MGQQQPHMQSQGGMPGQMQGGPGGMAPGGMQGQQPMNPQMQQKPGNSVFIVFQIMLL